jgi:NTE family protein
MTNGTPLRPVSYDKKVGLVLPGGGALGSYQAGVYEALASLTPHCNTWWITLHAAAV